MRNLIATLLLSRRADDCAAATSWSHPGGNNNAYCQRQRAGRRQRNRVGALGRRTSFCCRAPPFSCYAVRARTATLPRSTRIPLVLRRRRTSSSPDGRSAPTASGVRIVQKRVAPGRARDGRRDADIGHNRAPRDAGALAMLRIHDGRRRPRPTFRTGNGERGAGRDGPPFSSSMSSRERRDLLTEKRAFGKSSTRRMPAPARDRWRRGC